MIVNIALIIVILAQQILHYIERGNLQDRIMSRSLQEYKQSDEKPTSAKSAHERVLRKWRGSDRE